MLVTDIFQCLSLIGNILFVYFSVLTLYHTIMTLNDPKERLFENIVGKEGNAGNQHFLLFPQSFLLFTKQLSTFKSHQHCRLQMLSIWTSPQFCPLLKSLVLFNTYIESWSVTLYHKMSMIIDHEKGFRLLKTFWEKGENAGCQHFLLFKKCCLSFFLPPSILFCHLQCFQFGLV